ncbi:MAG: inositol monophosphatase family protein [Gammaproteobacteria bacterium]|nr:inositol monophosphatase family protein [Gammaproteobacteria bacterium]
MHSMVNIAVRAARKAGEVITRSLDKMGSINITEKGPNDFVTEVDKAAEEAILYTLGKAFPEHSYLTEETGEIINGDPNSIWIIDPLDGTTNFIHGLPQYCVSIAFQQNGVIEHGVIYHPLTQDLFTASRGQGAQLNGKRIRVSKQNRFEGAMISCNIPRDPNYMKQYCEWMTELHDKVAGFRKTGSTALDLAYLAAGYTDAFWTTSLQPWDMAAGSLLVREAGGIVTDLEGGVNFMEQRTIIASNPKLIKSVLQLVRK